MDNIDSAQIIRIKRLNRPEFIRLRLFTVYTLLSLFFFCIGALLNYFCGRAIPELLADNIFYTFCNPVKWDAPVTFISSIIYNSVDIFKISFIIMLAGFTYICSSVTRVTAAFYGICNGFSLSFCIDTLLTDTGFQNTYYVVLVTVCSLLMYTVIFIGNCVRAEITASEFSEYRNPRLLLTSGCFWRYIGGFLISFGYVLIICTASRCILNLLM